MSVLISKVAVGLPNRKLSQIVSLMKHTNIIKYGLLWLQNIIQNILKDTHQIFKMFYPSLIIFYHVVDE